MKRLILLTILSNLLLCACTFGVSQEFAPPTPLVVVPTPISEQHETVQPVATASEGETAGDLTPPTLPIPTPYATNESTSLAQVDNLYFAASSYGLPQGLFPSGTEEVFAIWDYADMSDDDVLRRVWLKNDEEWLVREETWDVVTYGSSGTRRDVSVYDFEGSGLAPGLYELELYVNDTIQALSTFQIQEEQNLATSTETQLAWVKDGHILMLDAWDGSQRELARVAEGNEIVELVWLSDARHLLYVDQQPAEPDGPPWPHHALWLVDTETAVTRQLSSYEENLHRIAVLPGARYIRTIAGTDFGDACFMDRHLIFMELDENYQRLTLHNLRDFKGALADTPYWFYPEDAGKWLSDRGYEVSVSAFCLTPDMGASAEDLALIGRYRLDLEEGTAVKIGD